MEAYQPPWKLPKPNAATASIGLFSSPSAPAVPDPAATAAAQGAANKDTAIAQAQLNMVNQVTPNGSLTYNQSGTGSDGTPMYTATTQLSPQAQAINDASQKAQAGTYGVANQAIGNVANTLNTPFSTAGLPAAPTGDQAYVDSATNALYGQEMSRLQPQQATQQKQFNQQMANSGIPQTSDAYKNANQQFQQGQNDAMQTALNQAIAGGSAAASNQFGMQSAANQNAYNQAVNTYNMPINQVATLMGSGGSVPGINTVATPQTNVNGTDVIGATNGALAANQSAYNSQLQNQAGLFGALGSLGGTLGAAAMLAPAASDRRLKTNIRRIGQLANGLPTYRFNYIWDKTKEYVGVMADEVLKVIPQAVFKMPNGYMAVYYGMLGT